MGLFARGAQFPRFGEWKTNYGDEHALGKRRFERILGATPTAMLVVGADGTVEFANDEALRLFGYERDDLVGRPVEVLVPLALRGAHPAARSAFNAAPMRRPMGADATSTRRGRTDPSSPSRSD